MKNPPNPRRFFEHKYALLLPEITVLLMGTGTGNFCVEKFLLSGHEKAAKEPLIGDLSCFFANFCINSFLALFARKPSLGSSIKYIILIF